MATETGAFHLLTLTFVDKDGVKTTAPLGILHIEVPPFVPSPMVEGPFRLVFDSTSEDEASEHEPTSVGRSVTVEVSISGSHPPHSLRHDFKTDHGRGFPADYLRDGEES